MSINGPTDPWLHNTLNCWPLEEHYYADVFAVSASFKTHDPPLWSGLLSPSARAAVLRENRGHCLNCPEDTRSFRNNRHPIINARGCLNPELSQLGDDDAYRRWQARMTSYRRDGKSSRTHNHKKTSRHRPGQSRRYHQEQGQVNSHNSNSGNPYTSGHHGGVAPSPTSPAPVYAPGMRLGDAHNPDRKPERVPARNLSHRQMTARWRYDTPGLSADSTVGGTSVCFARHSCACCEPTQ